MSDNTEGTNARVGSTRRALRMARSVPSVGLLPRALGASQDGNMPQVLNKPSPGKDWIDFGRQNLFPQFVTGLVHNFQPLLSAVDAMSLYLAGRGVVFLDAQGQPVQAARDKWLELVAADGEAAFLRNVFKDLVILGGRSFEVVWDGTQMPSRVYHLDVTRLRCKPKVNGVVEAYKWCSDWALLRSRASEVNIEEITSFDAIATASGPKKKAVSYRRMYTPGADYYGWPWWIGAITDMEVGARVPRFNVTQLDTGFRPAFHIHVFTDRDDVDLDQLDADIEAVWTGVDGKTYVVTHGTVAEGAPQLTKLERGDHAGELDKMGDRSELIAYKAVGIPPILMGIDVNTGLSGKGLAIEQTVTMFQRTRCEPLQDMVTADALRIVQLCGVKGVVSAKMQQLQPFEAAADQVLQRQAYIASVLVGEHRLATGGKLLTIDGKEPRPDMSNVDPRMNLTLSEALRGSGNLDPVVPNA